MEIFILILFCFILPCIVLIKPIKDMIKNKKNIKEILKEYKEEIILFFILILGSLIRIIAIGKYPNALNADEASSGYEAWSILKSGIDRSGNSFPVVLYAWGSGQNALYSYLLIPVICLTGLCEFGLRLPMAIIGIISLYVFYYLLKNIFNDKKIALVGVAFLAICPWHIMKSRWALESNIFPDLILISLMLLVLGIKNKKKWMQTLSFVILGISSYAYGTAYLFLPVFVFGVLLYLWRKKEISIKRAGIYLAIVFVVSIPIILYVIINTFNLSQLSIGPVTIPLMKENRSKEVSTVFSENIYENCITNLLDSLKIILIQSDGLEWNSISDYGLFYGFSTIFLIYGIYISFRKYKKNEFNIIMQIWSASAIILCAFCIPNINRINIIMFPCIYYIAIGLYEIFSKYKIMISCIIAIYVGVFICFMQDYFQKDYNEYSTFTSGIKEVSEYCEKSDLENVYCYYSFKEPFIYFLFYSEYDVNNYLNTVEFFDEAGVFDNVKSFGKYKFYLPEYVPDDSIIVVPKGSSLNYENNIKNKITINQFDLYEF